MKSPIAKILSRFSKAFRNVMSGIAVTILNNLDDDSSAKAATEHAWAAYEVASRVGGAVRQSVKESYEVGAGRTIKLFPSHLDKAWDDSGMTLSEKLHGSDKEMRDAIVETIREQLKENRHVMQAARKLYDGYNSGQAVTRQQGIPKYLQQIVAFARHSDLTDNDRNDLLRQVRRARRQVERLGQGGAPNKALKTAYSELLDAVVNGSEKALSRSVHTAVEEKSRYVAERIARTEAARAWADGFAEKYMNDDTVVAFRWKLSSRHPAFDICNLYAEADLYGLGKGIFPKDQTPRLPVHPHCLCHLAPVYRSELNKIAHNLVKSGGEKYINALSFERRQKLLGVAGSKRYQQGVDWRTLARNYSPEVLQSREKRDIIKVGGDTAMYRHTSRKDGIEPISDKRFKELTTQFEKMGIAVLRGDARVEAHLAKNHAEASIVGNIAMFSSNVSLSGVLEEMYHFRQNQNGLNDDKKSDLRTLLNEIDAKQYLIDHRQKYGIPRLEDALTRKQLAEYQKALDKYRKRKGK